MHIAELARNGQAGALSLFLPGCLGTLAVAIAVAVAIYFVICRVLKNRREFQRSDPDGIMVDRFTDRPQ